jgi:hypothetical protein
MRARIIPREGNRFKASRRKNHGRDDVVGRARHARAMEPTPEVTALYREAPEGFIAGRDQLVKELQGAGRPEDAKVVKALRKPTVVAWALNQLADRDAKGVAELLEAGAELRAAQMAAMSGRGADRLRTATDARRASVTRLGTEAAGALRDAGKDPEPHADEIRSALEAAAVNEEAGEGLRTGTLERPPRPESGFGDLGGLTLVPDAPTGSTRATAKKEPPPPDLRELTRRRDAERKRAEREQATADDLASQVEVAESQLGKLKTRHREAVERAKAAELDARRAERTLRKAQE